MCSTQARDINFFLLFQKLHVDFIFKRTVGKTLAQFLATKKLHDLMTKKQATISAKSPCNTHTVFGIFHTLPPSYNVESIAEALSFLERHHFSIQCNSYHLQATLSNGGGDFWQTL